ncbi:hypothetical protein H4R20_005370 [Coemansia guatemalensis]|uniref:Uncharacterized protein n=1 Tax=Coemansia guatemalensis TaxID=2761395 RepID=A0A9W8HPY1_9FUNG|nr:hypothetical protein H4R20_005370 [Coemansia guatemalensis]
MSKFIITVALLSATVSAHVYSTNKEANIHNNDKNGAESLDKQEHAPLVVHHHMRSTNGRHADLDNSEDEIDTHHNGAVLEARKSTANGRPRFARRRSSKPAQHHYPAPPMPAAWIEPTPTPEDVAGAISRALLDPQVEVAGGSEFSALLLSAIESNGGNMPVVSI